MKTGTMIHAIRDRLSDSTPLPEVTQSGDLLRPLERRPNGTSIVP